MEGWTLRGKLEYINTDELQIHLEDENGDYRVFNTSAAVMKSCAKKWFELLDEPVTCIIIDDQLEKMYLLVENE